MPTTQRYDFEDQFKLKPVSGQKDCFTHVYQLWSLPHVGRVAGCQVLAQMGRAAYYTVPSGYQAHNLQAHFFKSGLVDAAMTYQVERTFTSEKFAHRFVKVWQSGIVKAHAMLSFMNMEIDAKRPTLYDYVPPPSKESLKALAQPIDPRLNDANFSDKPLVGDARAPPDWPPAAQFPAIRNQRLSVSSESDIGERIYRCKVGVTSPLSSRMAQIVGVMFLSDIYFGDTPLSVQNIPFGLPTIGELKKRLTEPKTKQMATLDHSLHFRKLEGWDLRDDVLFECRLRWAKGRRAVSQLTIRDCKGDVIATAEQEVSTVDLVLWLRIIADFRFLP